MEKFFKNLQNQKVILGTSSYYRQETFKKLNIPYKIVKSDFEENLDHSSFSSPTDYCITTSEEKAKDIFQKVKNEDFNLLITCDTICVDSNNKILEKPKDWNEHIQFLKSYSGKYLDLITSMRLILKENDHFYTSSSSETTRIFWE